MKKFIALLLLFAIVLSMTGCGKGQLFKSIYGKKYLGTWVCSEIEIDGVKEDVNSADEKYYTDLADGCIVFQKDGKAYTNLGNNPDGTSWTADKDGVRFSTARIERCENGSLKLDLNGNYIYFTKSDKSQELPWAGGSEYTFHIPTEEERQFYFGTWKISNIEPSSDSEESGGDYDELYFVIRESGAEYDTYSHAVDYASWRIAEEGIVIGDRLFIRDGDLIYSDYSVGRVYCEKISESMIFPSREPKAGGYTYSGPYEEPFTAPMVPANLSVPTNLSKDDVREEFGEYMNSCSKFFDGYVAFMKKYKYSVGKDSMTSLNMLGEYFGWLENCSKAVDSLNAVGDMDMTKAEKERYDEVSEKISEMLLDTAY